MRKTISPDLAPPIPREHGAWGILIGSFLSVIAITHTVLFSQLFFLLAIAAFYLARHSFLLVLKSGDIKSRAGWFITFTIIGWIFLAGAAISAQYFQIIIWSSLLLIFLLLEIWLIRHRKQASFSAQLAGTVGLTAIAPLSLMLYQKDFTSFFIFTWVINILFFTSGILFVRYQISAMKENASKRSDFKKYKAAMICYHFTLLILLFLSVLYFDKFWGLFIAFVPILAQSFIAILVKLNFRNLRVVGWLEIAQTLCFIALLAIFFAPANPGF